MIRLVYAPDLVEETVLLAEARTPGAAWRAFRRERDRLYGLREEDQREERFGALHFLQFNALALHHVIEHAITERSDICERVGVGRILRAVRRTDEGADLVDRVVPDGGASEPLLVLRLRPATLLDPPSLRALLRHELTHVSDMLDPAFGYERTLPSSDDGPSGDNILRDRYRVLWDVTIDARLARAGLGCEDARSIRRQEFAAAFPMLGDCAGDAFDAWFEQCRPTHAALVAFARSPGGGEHSEVTDSGRCPLCRFPVASLDGLPERLSAGAAAAIREDHPAWSVARGLCSQCFDLYEARDAAGHSGRGR